jgi:hypothetical protein
MDHHLNERAARFHPRLEHTREATLAFAAAGNITHVTLTSARLFAHYTLRCFEQLAIGVIAPSHLASIRAGGQTAAHLVGSLKCSEQGQLITE